MNDENSNELRELLGRFYDSEEARDAFADICEGERILESYPAPEADEGLLAEIKGGFSARYAQAQRRHIRHRRYELSSVAATIVIFASLWFGLKGNGPSGDTLMASLIPTAVWESEDISTADEDLAYLNAAVSRMEYEIERFRSGDSPASSDSAIPEIEMELMELEGDFWKG